MQSHTALVPTTRSRYDTLSRAFHWIFAAVILYALCAGYTMHVVHDKTTWSVLSIVNMSLTSILLLLYPARFIWKFLRKEPDEIDSIPPVQRAVAHAVHALIYAAVAIVLVSGYLMVPQGYSFFWLVKIHTPFAQGARTDFWLEIHRVACAVLGVLVVLHAAAALKHHFVLKNGVLKKML